jgi:hypothetical protein
MMARARTAEEQAAWNRLSVQERQRQNQAQTAGRGGTAAPAGPATPPPINYRDPVAVSGAVAQRGLDAVNDPTTVAAQTGARNILAGQGGAGSGTGYQNYNPINDTLAQRLLAEPSDADELVRQFLGVQGTVGAKPAPYDPKDPYAVRPGAIQVVNYGGGGSIGGAQGAGGAAGGGVVPDATGTGVFGTKIRELLDSGVNAADIQTMIDAQNADINRGLSSSLWGLDAAAQGTGRLGGDTWSGLQNQARRDAVGQMGTFAASTRLGAQKQLQDLYQGLLGQVNARDIAAMNDATQRFGIATNASTSGAGSAEANATARRAQDLNALGMLLSNQQFGQGQLGDLGARLSTDQLSAMGLAPDLAGVGLSGLGAANQAAGTEAGLAASRMNAGVARSGQNLQAEMFNSQLQQQQVNDYLRLIMGLGSMGGTSTTQGQNVVAGLGVNPTGAAIQGGLGAGLAAYGYGRGG